MTDIKWLTGLAIKEEDGLRKARDRLLDVDMWRELVEAYGEQEADRLVICEFGSTRALYEHAVATGYIEE